eukprot:3933374-Rhodomonas_salina.1
MFGGEYYCRDGIEDPVDGSCIKGVHPYHKNREFSAIRNFTTTDGLCFYDANRDVSNARVQFQRVPLIYQTQHPCSFWNQMRRVLYGTWGVSQVMTDPLYDCSEILDWPAQPMEYRNGEAAGTEPTWTQQPQQCPMLGRVSPFAMKIMSDAPLHTSTDQTTSDTGGDCHMGRATNIPKNVKREMAKYELCLTVARTSTQASVRCTGFLKKHMQNSGTAYASDNPDRLFVLQREIRQHPVADVIQGPTGMPRQRCDQCDVDTGVPTMGPGGSHLDFPETSVGIMHRISTERLLVNEIMRYCDRQHGCKLSADGFRDGQLLTALLQDPQSVIETENPESLPFSRLEEDIENIPESVASDDDTPLWDYPWIFSNGCDAEPLGSITKKEWKLSKYAKCWEQVEGILQSDDTGTFVRPISFCDVTGPLQELCQALLNAKQDIINANCIAQGDSCEILGTYYTPAQWSPTNKAFARETVRDYYRNEASDACLAEPDRVLLAQNENELIQAACSASTLEAFKDGLQLARLAVRMILAGFMSMSAIVVDLFMLIFHPLLEMDAADIVNDIMYNIGNLLQLWEAAILQLLDLFIYLLSTISPIGSMFADTFAILCTVVHMIYVIVFKGFVCNIVKGGLVVLITLVDAIVKAVQFLGGGGLNIDGWSHFKSDFDGFLDSLPCDSVSSGIYSSANGDLGCRVAEPSASARIRTHKYVPTRCWTNPALGDALGESDILGCSASDTCILDGAGDGNGVCEMCPPVDVNNFARFGCDIYRKQCKCSVPLQTKTNCLRNSDCQAHVPCALMADANSPSFGVQDCLASCSSQPICLVQSTAFGDIEAIGQCVCMLHTPTIHQCDTQGALLPLPIESGMCMFARDKSLADTITVYSRNILQYSSLAVTMCPLLSRAGEHLTCQR